MEEYPEAASNKFFEIETQSFWFQHRSQVIMAWLEKFQARAPFADIGGGNGHQALSIQEKYGQCALVEPSEDGCRNAKNRGLKQVINGRLDSLHNHSAWGTLCFFDVLEHLKDPGQLLSQAQRLLEDNGTLIVTVPSFRFLWNQDDDYAKHQTRYTRSSLTKLIENAGFQIVASSYFFLPLFFPVLLLKALPYVFVKRTGYNYEQHTPKGMAAAAVKFALRIERLMMEKGVNLPFGTSLILIARKRKAADGQFNAA